MEDLFLASRLGRIHCRATGSGPVLFLMHSAGRSAYEFDALAGLLADSFRVVAWDMPGHGDSDRLLHHVEMTELADLAVALAVDLASAQSGGQAAARPLLAGGSIGAAIALAAAARHGADLAGIIPIELPLSRDGAWWAGHWPMIEDMFGCPEEPEERARPRYRDWTPDFARRLQIDRHKAGSSGMMAMLWAGRDDADATRDRLSNLAVPALFINGDKGVAPEAGDLLPRLAPAAKLVTVANSGHFPHTDDPGAVASAIMAWTARS